MNDVDVRFEQQIKINDEITRLLKQSVEWAHKAEERIKRLEAIVERQSNQIENAFNIFSKEGEHY